MPAASNGKVPDSAEVEGPVFTGEGCEIAAGVRLTGPVVIGDGVRIGENSALRDTIVCPHTDVDPGTVLICAVASERPLAEKLTAERLTVWARGGMPTTARVHKQRGAVSRTAEWY